MISSFNHSPDLGWMMLGAAFALAVAGAATFVAVWMLSRALWRAWKRR